MSGQHDPATRLSVKVNIDCAEHLSTMREQGVTATEVVRQAIALHKFVHDGGKLTAPADLPVATGDAGTEDCPDCAAFRARPSGGEPNWTCFTCGRDRVEEPSSTAPATSAAGSSPEPCDECEETGRNCPTHAAGSSPEDDGAREGTCATCGGVLVQVPGERTYHPAATSDPANPCPALLPIPGTKVPGFDVPDDRFIAGSSPEDAGERVGLTEEEIEALDVCPDCGGPAYQHNDLGRTVNKSVCQRNVSGARRAAVEHILAGRLAAVEQERERAEARAAREANDAQEWGVEAAALREQQVHRDAELAKYLKSMDQTDGEVYTSDIRAGFRHALAMVAALESDESPSDAARPEVREAARFALSLREEARDDDEA